MKIKYSYKAFIVVLILISIYFLVLFLDYGITHYALKRINTNSDETKITLRHFVQPKENIFFPKYFLAFLENVTRNKPGILVYKPFYVILIVLYLALSIFVLILLFPLRKRITIESMDAVLDIGRSQTLQKHTAGVVKNTTYIFSARVFNAIFVFLLFIAVSRGLGAGLFGTYVFLQTIVLTGTSFANFGFDILMVREVSKDNNLGKLYLSNILGLKILTSVITIAVFAVTLPFFISDDVARQLFYVFITTILFNSLSQTFWYYGDSFERLRCHSVLWVISNFLKTVIGIIMVVYTRQIDFLMYGLVLAEFISLIISFFFIRRSFGSIGICFDFSFYKELFIKVYPIGIGLILGVLYFRVDIVMLGLMKGQEYVGWYSASWKIIEGFTIVPGSIILSTFPTLSKNFDLSKTLYWMNVKKAIGVLFFSGLFIAIGLSLCAKYIIIISYGAEFIMSIPVLKILSMMLLLLFINWFLAYVLISIGKEKYNTVCLAIVTGLNILVNIFMIPAYGHIGAAWTALISEIILIMLYSVKVFRMWKGRMHAKELCLV